MPYALRGLLDDSSWMIASAIHEAEFKWINGVITRRIEWGN